VKTLPPLIETYRGVAASIGAVLRDLCRRYPRRVTSAGLPVSCRPGFRSRHLFTAHYLCAAPGNKMAELALAVGPQGSVIASRQRPGVTQTTMNRGNVSPPPGIRLYNPNTNDHRLPRERGLESLFPRTWGGVDVQRSLNRNEITPV